MNNQNQSIFEFTIEDIDRELIARGRKMSPENQFDFKDKEGCPERDRMMQGVKELYESAASFPVNEELRHISTPELIQLLMLKFGVSGTSNDRGVWLCDYRRDFYEITEDPIRDNACRTAAIYTKDYLPEGKSGLSSLKIKHYGDTFKLCDCEPFRDQPIAAGRLLTGFLVEEDVIATAGHVAHETEVTDLRIVFGYRMTGPMTPVIDIPNEHIYKGVKFLGRVYDRLGNGSDWALIQLDRNVKAISPVVLSEKEVYCNQPVYVIGYPVGLPLKVAPGGCVHDIADAWFTSDLDIYSGNSGSPIFDSQTHEVIGIVVRGDNRDFRWTGNGWLSVIYPNPDIHSKGAQCTKITELRR
ncbi:MAG: trypsin-like serine peptidase [Candidatus Omnitrophota bacterium]